MKSSVKINSLEMMRRFTRFVIIYSMLVCTESLSIKGRLPEPTPVVKISSTSSQILTPIEVEVTPGNKTSHYALVDENVFKCRATLDLDSAYIIALAAVVPSMLICGAPLVTFVILCIVIKAWDFIKEKLRKKEPTRSTTRSVSFAV